MPPSRELQAALDAGLTAFRNGNIDAAGAAFAHSVAIAPNDPDALNLYGALLLHTGEAPSALEYLQKAARTRRNDPGVLGNLAQAYFMLKRYEEAGETFRKASRLQPGVLQFQLGTANSLAMTGKLELAETLLEKLSVRFAGSSLVWFNLGNVQRDRQRPVEALASFRRAISLDPGNVDARNSVGSMLHGSLQFEDAEREYRACIAMAPDYLLARCNLASVIIDMGRFEEAADLCRDVIRLAPALPLAHSFLGAALGHQGRVIDALRSHAKAAELSPSDAKIAQNYASALADSGRFIESLRWYAHSLKLNPELVSTRQLLAYALLGNGCFAEGWAEYVHRPWPKLFETEHPGVALTQQLPADLKDKRILVVKEQGLGDEIFFLRFAAQLHSRGARITYRSSTKIRSLLARSPLFERVLDEGELPQHVDARILVGDLPNALSETPKCDVPRNDAAFGAATRWPVRLSIYQPAVPEPLALAPLPERVAEMRGRLKQAGAPPYIGLTWRAGTAPAEQRAVIWVLHKEIGIPAFASAVSAARGTFIAVQRKPQLGEIESLSLALGHTVHDFTDLNDDLEGMLALMAVLDEYIGVSNTNTHLRASVGRTARVLVPAPPDWRWMMNHSKESPWFPGFPVYRQSLDGNWSSAVEQLQQDLLRAPA